MKKLSFRPSPAMVVAGVALFVALGGTGLAATYVVSSNRQVGPGTISGHRPPAGDHANVITGSLNALDLATGAVGPRKLTTNAVTTAKVANGAVTAPKLAASAIGARAYGRIVETTVTRSKNITGVTNPSPGEFCITLAPSINPASTGVVVTPDFNGDSTGFGTNSAQSIAEWSSSASGCPAGRLEVRTGARLPQGGGDSVNQASNQAFFVVVP